MTDIESDTDESNLDKVNDDSVSQDDETSDPHSKINRAAGSEKLDILQKVIDESKDTKKDSKNDDIDKHKAEKLRKSFYASIRVFSLQIET